MLGGNLFDDAGDEVTILAVLPHVTFANLGRYQARTNPPIIIMFIAAAALIAATLYLIMDMEQPFDGPIRVSPAPIERALGEIRLG